MVPADAEEIMRLKLRKSDERELLAAMPGLPLREVLRLCTQAPNTMVTLFNGEIFGLYGSLPDPMKPGMGIIWSFGTDEAYAQMETLNRLAKCMVKEWLDIYPVGVGNYMSMDNTVCIKWIKGLGFAFEGPEIDMSGSMFRYFARYN